MKYKKSQTTILNISYIMLAIFVGTIITIFASVTIFEGIGQEGINRIYDVGVQFESAGQIDNTMLLHLEDLKDDYHNFNWFPDLFTFWILAQAFILTLIASYKTASEGWLSFFGYLTIGSYIFLLLVGFIMQFVQWFWGEYFTRLFYDLSYSLSFTTWLIENGTIIFFVWFLIIIFVNKFTFANSRKKDSEFEFDKINDDEVFIEE